MKNPVCLAALAFSLTLSPVAAQTNAPVVGPVGGASPILINSCGPNLNRSSNASGPSVFGIPLTSTSNGISIEFVNQATVAATLINFAVDSNGDHFVIRDVGTFSPGVSIQHNYRNGSGQGFLLPAFIAPQISCHVASVKFADGTDWRKGEPPASRESAQSAVAPGPLTASPARIDIDADTDAELFLVQTTSDVAGFKEADTCSGIASISIAASGDTSATYSVRPIAAGRCSASVTDESGHTIAVPIAVH